MNKLKVPLRIGWRKEADEESNWITAHFWMLVMFYSPMAGIIWLASRLRSTSSWSGLRWKLVIT